MKKAFVLLLVLSLGGVVAKAQQSDVASLREAVSENTFGVKPASSPFSLLDPSRITWSHSYSISYFSGGSRSGSMGLLQSTMFYDLLPSLSLSLNVGVLHDGAALWGDGQNNTTVLPGFSLHYHPSDKFQMSLIYQRYSGLLSPYFHRGYRSWYDPVNPY